LVIHVFPPRASFHRPPQFALAAIAASMAFFAPVIRAGVLGAVYANVGGRLAADAACHCRGIGHILILLPLYFVCINSDVGQAGSLRRVGNPPLV
jgi:hypothetical protein